MDAIQLQKQLGIQTPSPIQRVYFDKAHHASHPEIWCKRDDLVHPIISGNKWRKLSPILMDAMTNNTKRIVSFGGAHSNHLHALSYCCYQLGIELIAIVRAYPTQPNTPTMQDMLEWYTKIHYASRLEYKERNNLQLVAYYKDHYAADMVIPEGGSCVESLEGAKSLIDEIAQQVSSHPRAFFDEVYVPVGSAATLAGLVRYGHKVFTHVTGIAVLKGEGYLEKLTNDLLDEHLHTRTAACQADKNLTQWHIEHQFHHGGYAKTNALLQAFMRQFSEINGFDLESVYSGKCFYGLNKKLNQTPHKRDTQQAQKILIIHTGGMQGLRAQKTINI